MRCRGRGAYGPPAAPVAVVVAVIALVGTFGAARHAAGHRAGPGLGATPLDGWAVLLVLVGPAAILLLRRWRFAALAVSIAAVVAYVSLGYPAGPVFVAPVAALWLEVIRSRRERWAAHRREQRLSQEGRASQERIAMARELHDVLGHSLSVINVQAGVALHLLDEHPENLRPALQTIKTVSHEALEEVRTVLDALRDPGSVSRAPAPGLSRVTELVEQTRDGPVRWDLSVTGTRGAVPAHVDGAAYRVVQEAMTNVRRHAQASHASVEVAYADRSVAVRVADDGRGAGRPTAPGVPPTSGTGLDGMRARVEALGGTFHAADVSPHGFAVEARLPWRNGEGEQ